jgi:hypothetical protein
MNVEPLISTEEDPDLYCCCITALNSGKFPFGGLLRGIQKKEDMYFATAKAAYLSLFLLPSLKFRFNGTRKKFGCYYGVEAYQRRQL